VRRQLAIALVPSTSSATLPGSGVGAKARFVAPNPLAKTVSVEESTPPLAVYLTRLHFRR